MKEVHRTQATIVLRRLSALIEELKSDQSTRTQDVIHDEIAKNFSELALMEDDLRRRSHFRGISRKHAARAARIRVGVAS